MWQEIIGNCDTRLGLGMSDTLSAEYFCSLIGVSTVETTSVRKENSIEGDIAEFGQKNISTLQRNLLNVDEILRIPATKLLVNLRGNKPLLLDKIMYKEHHLSKKLKDSPISEYNPKWVINKSDKEPVQEKVIEKPSKKEKLGWHNF